MKIKLAWLWIGLLLTSQVWAEEPNDLKAQPDVLLKSRLTQVMSVLKQKDMDPNVMATKIEKVVVPLFDFNVMSRLAIRDYWQKMSKEQQAEYVPLFTKYLKDSYRNKLMLYSDEEVTYKKPVITKPTLIQIPTQLVSADKTIDVIYYFRKTKGFWKIYNVKIQGIGLIESYKSQFNEVIQKDGIDALLEQLKSSQPEESAPDSASN